MSGSFAVKSVSRSLNYKTPSKVPLCATQNYIKKLGAGRHWGNLFPCRLATHLDIRQMERSTCAAGYWNKNGNGATTFFVGKLTSRQDFVQSAKQSLVTSVIAVSTSSSWELSPEVYHN